MSNDISAIPQHFEPDKVGSVWRVPYQEVAVQASQWREEHQIPPASEDSTRIALLLTDVQNTFCIPGFELFVQGRGGRDSVADNERLCRFIYQNLHRISRIYASLDTHQAIQIFHSIFLVDKDGKHPDPLTVITPEKLGSRWKINPPVARHLGLNLETAESYLQHYADSLHQEERLDWTIWPYHAVLGGIGHAMVAAVHEAVFFHSICRHTNPRFIKKGDNPLTEHYSLIGPEVLKGPEGKTIAAKDTSLVREWMEYDALFIGGQAQSHCVSWTVEDLLSRPEVEESGFAEKLYLLDDCTSPVVVPDVVDYTEEAESAFHRFSKKGAHRIKSTSSLSEILDL